VTTEFLQCGHRERKLKLVFAHTVSKLGSPVSCKVLVTKNNFIHLYLYISKIYTDYRQYKDHNAQLWVKAKELPHLQVTTLGKLFTHDASVIKQYNLVPVKGR